MMNKARYFLSRYPFLAGLGVFCLFCTVLVFYGCKGQTGTVMKKGDKGLSGSHKAGQEVFRPLVDEAVGRLLAAEAQQSMRPMETGAYGGVNGYGQPGPYGATPAGAYGNTPEMYSGNGYGMHGMPPGPKQICFVGVENFSAEELGDFKEMLYEMIDTAVGRGGQYTCISRRFVEAALRQERFRMDDLFIPMNQRKLQRILEQENKPFEFLLFAKLASGTTVDNKNYQRDYNLSLELVNINNGARLKESCDLSKAYNVTMGAKMKNR